MKHRNLSLAIALCSAVVLAVAPSATAATWSAYLSWGGSLPVSCTGTTYSYTSTSTYDPAAHSRTFFVRSSSSGNVVVNLSAQDGVRKADRYYGCQKGTIRNDYIPTVYNYRTHQQTFLCYGGSCQYTGTLVSSWRAGTY